MRSAASRWRAPASGGAFQERLKHLALFTDLYELTMLRAYRELGLDRTAVFSLFVRRLPEGWNFLVASGIEEFLQEIEALRFDAGDIDYLRSAGLSRDVPRMA